MPDQLAWLSGIFDCLVKDEGWSSLTSEDRAKRLKQAAKRNHFRHGRPQADWDNLAKLNWVEMLTKLESQVSSNT